MVFSLLLERFKASLAALLYIFVSLLSHLVILKDCNQVLILTLYEVAQFVAPIKRREGEPVNS